MIISLFFLLFSTAMAEKEFLPHMIDHENLGCPENSQCSKKIGVIRQQLVEIAKSNKKNKISKLKSFSRTFGMPVALWGLEESEKNSDYIIWDSPCKNHNNEKKPRVNILEVFTKDISSLVKSEQVIVPKGLLLDNKKNIQTLNLLRSDAPVLLSNSSVFYIREIEGLFYTLELKRNGKINVLESPKIRKYPHEVNCPKELSEKFKTTYSLENLYLGHFCKNVWNIDTNSYDTLALGWSCN